MTLSNLAKYDTKRRAVSLRQLNFLLSLAGIAVLLKYSTSDEFCISLSFTPIARLTKTVHNCVLLLKQLLLIFQ